MLVKHGRVNPYYGYQIQDNNKMWVFLVSARPFSHTLARFLPPNGLWDDFPCNGKQSAWTLKGTASDYK